ncbi:MAG: hypothetical protein FWD68_12210 [Alphaproteobacteria bacterium]|nr:hypothetical protein [Alphaproteobacteria bacterium]
MTPAEISTNPSPVVEFLAALRPPLHMRLEPCRIPSGEKQKITISLTDQVQFLHSVAITALGRQPSSFLLTSGSNPAPSERSYSQP